MHVTSYAAIEAFTTLDGSEIREWAGAVSAPARNQSLAEATIAVEKATTAHYHRKSEELYLVVEGLGRLVVDGEEREIAEGDTIMRKIALDKRALAELPALGAVLRSRDWRGLVRYAGSRDAEPVVRATTS